MLHTYLHNRYLLCTIPSLLTSPNLAMLCCCTPDTLLGKNTKQWAKNADRYYITLSQIYPQIESGFLRHSRVRTNWL